MSALFNQSSLPAKRHDRQAAPDLAAKRGHVHCTDDFIEGLMLLRSTEQLRLFFKELVDAMIGLAPEEPDSKLYIVRRDGASNLYESFKEKADPATSEVRQLLSEILKTAISTRKETTEESPPPAAPAAFKPHAMANGIYAGRRQAAAKRGPK